MSWFDLEAGNEAEVAYKSNNSFEIRGEKLITLKEVYIVESTKSEAKGLKVKFQYDNNIFGNETFWYINKDTGTQRNAEGKPTFGSLQIKEFFGALGLDIASMKPEKRKIQVGKEADKIEEVNMFPTLYDKQLLVVVQMQEEENYNTQEIELKPSVIGWFDPKTRKNYKELANGTEAKAILSYIKRSEKDKVFKERATTNGTSSVEVEIEDNPFA